MEGMISMMQVLFSFLFLVQTSAAAGVDPVEFLLSKDSPKNKPEVPLPANFQYSGDPKTDCCSLVLWVTVKDWSPSVDPDDYEDDLGEEPPEDNAPQIEHGVVHFNLSHPQIRNDDSIFSIHYVKNEMGKVKERFIIKFDKCGSITHKIFGIYASTDIIDTKDIRIEITDGKDIGVDCSTNTTAPTITVTANGTPTWMVLAILGWLAFAIAIGVIVYQHKKKTRHSPGIPEKAVAYSDLNNSENEEVETLGTHGGPRGMPRGGKPEKAVPYSDLNDLENEEIKTPGTRGTPRGGTKDITLNSGDKNNVVCGKIKRDNLLPLITGVIAIISFVFAIIATVIYFTLNDTPTQVANDIIQSPTL